jgi:hypothetical protein
VIVLAVMPGAEAVSLLLDDEPPLPLEPHAAASKATAAIAATARPDLCGLLM